MFVFFYCFWKVLWGFTYSEMANLAKDLFDGVAQTLLHRLAPAASKHFLPKHRRAHAAHAVSCQAVPSCELESPKFAFITEPISLKFKQVDFP